MATGLQNAHNNVLVEALKQGLQSFVQQYPNAANAPSLVATTTAGAPASGKFYSTITNRAAIPDISQDLKASLGIERIPSQQIALMQTEFGPNGEPVFSLFGEDRGLIRFVGNGWTSANDVLGPRVENLAATTNGSYIEITFYGTSLNLLFGSGVGGGDLRVSVDGGAEGANIIGPTINTILNARYTNSNIIVPVVSGLALGVHTVKIRANTTGFGYEVCGFEVINANGSGLVNFNPGAGYIDFAKTVLTAQQSLAYNSGFETGTLGTRGGRVLAYLKLTGTIGRALTPVNASAAYLTASDHTNEEVSRVHHFREFGASVTRNDDFLSNTQITKAFVLEDGTTSLVGGASTVVLNNQSAGNWEYVGTSATNDTLTLTFVGCGVDIDIAGATGSTFDSSTVIVDGVSVGTVTCNNSRRVLRIASGLPYGTHTVRLMRNSTTGFGVCPIRYVVYQPKKPTLPSGAMEIADYNIMANYAMAASGIPFVSNGVLRKFNTREFQYVGTWTAGNSGFAYGSGTYINALDIYTQTSGSYFQYTFFGTGFELRGYANSTGQSSNVTATIAKDNGTQTALTSANFPSAAFGAQGGYTYGGLTNVTTGIAASNVLNTANTSASPSSAFSVSGLPLGVYTVRFTNNTTSTFTVEALDIITPIHATKMNVSALQNALPIGSTALNDTRKASALKDLSAGAKPWAQAIGVTSQPTTTVTSMVPMPDMSVSLSTAGGALQVDFHGSFYNTTNNNAYGQVQIVVDGVAIPGSYENTWFANAGGSVSQLITFANVPASAGVHKVDIYWQSGGGTFIAQGVQRLLRVKEI